MSNKNPMTFHFFNPAVTNCRAVPRVLGNLIPIFGALLNFLFVMVVADTDPTARAQSSNPKTTWLTSDAAERRGIAVELDLASPGPRWQLWSSGAGQPPLQSIEQFFSDVAGGGGLRGLGVNGGYWNEQLYPVGACAGANGIAAAHDHRWGLALTMDHAYIGPLTSGVQLNGNEIALNPRPLPHTSAFLIDPRSYPYVAKSEHAGRVFWLVDETSGPLRFNTKHQLRVSRIAESAAGAEIVLPPAGTILWFQPDRGSASVSATSPTPTLSPTPVTKFTRGRSSGTRSINTPNRTPTPVPVISVGSEVRLDLKLKPVNGEVQLTTCAGPLLLEGGKPSPSLLAWSETLRRKEEPRTMVGCDASGKHFWVVVLARNRAGRVGVSLDEAAQTMLELGVSEALNLDGGSSTCAWTGAGDHQLQLLFPFHMPIQHMLFLPGAKISN